jgi:hypothetical protein
MSDERDFEKEVLELKRILYNLRCRALAENYHMPMSFAGEVVKATSDVQVDSLLIDDLEVLLDTIEYICLDGPNEYQRDYAKKILIGTFVAFTMPRR